jgi:class 3 adenylate cyclase
VIEKILRDPKHLELGGEKRELTIMFTDLAGFSSFSERLGPVELTALLNDYLSEMTDIIMDEGGTLDKYEGERSSRSGTPSLRNRTTPCGPAGRRCSASAGWPSFGRRTSSAPVPRCG